MLDDLGFGLQLRAVREEQGLTREQLAERLGVSSATHIWEYESGRRDLYVATVRKFARALDVPASRLLEEGRE